eukprot:349738-Chlamydomonas_euryale.AAC.6
MKCGTGSVERAREPHRCNSNSDYNSFGALHLQLHCNCNSSPHHQQHKHTQTQGMACRRVPCCGENSAEASPPCMGTTAATRSLYLNRTLNMPAQAPPRALSILQALRATRPCGRRRRARPRTTHQPHSESGEHVSSPIPMCEAKSGARVACGDPNAHLAWTAAQRAPLAPRSV